MCDLDMLEKRLVTATGREKVDILIELGRVLYLKDPERMRIYIEEAHQLARELNYTIGIANSLRIKGNLYWVAGDYKSAMDHYQGAKKVYDRLEDFENL
ncbi:MAG: hypothetical protein ABIJ45_09420, partial [Candidatus Zixiibacteriota bacterium]